MEVINEIVIFFGMLFFSVCFVAMCVVAGYLFSAGKDLYVTRKQKKLEKRDKEGK